VVQPSAVFSYFTAIAPMHPTLIREPFHRDGDCERIHFMCCKMEDEARAAQMSGETRGNEMPLVTVFNLVKEDRLSEIDAALRKALISLPELKIKDHEIDLVPVLTAEGFPGTVTRINVDLWERPERTKDALQALATSIAKAFQNVAGSDRKVTVVVRPYDVEKSGWVSF
jgi:phenylpyruvate tautomerase PptA (4-oxalocrotonate tautomerase family)